MPSLPQPGAVLFARDVSRIARFYEQLLVMSVRFADERLVVLDGSGYQLVVHGIPPEVAATIDIATPPRRRTDVPVKLVLPVVSLADTRLRATALGGALDDDDQAFEAPGFRACDGHDPEGNVVQFREAA